MTIRLKRAYDPEAADDGYRVLVDRLWPRRLSKAQLKLDAWLRDVAPSSGLRSWFNHEPDKWPDFRRRYLEELASGGEEAVADLVARTSTGRVTLVFAAKDEQHNNAVVLKEYLETMAATSSGAAAEEDL